MQEQFHPSRQRCSKWWRKVSGSARALPRHRAAFLLPVPLVVCWVHKACAPGLCSCPGYVCFSPWNSWPLQGLGTSKGVQ